MLEISQMTDRCRYSSNLESLIERLKGEKVLELSYESDYSGHVDISVLLADGRVFSLYYSYGSCSGCDSWESRGLSDEEIEQEMQSDASYFESKSDYDKWVEMKKGNR